MNINLYQVNMDRDVNHVCFRSLEFTQRYQKSPDIDSSIYDKCYTCTLPAQSLEDVYFIFNQRHPDDYRCRSLSVSDILEISGSPHVKDGFYFCDSFGFKKIDFDPGKTQYSPTYNGLKAPPEKLADPKTGLIHLEARLGICLEVTPEEFMRLLGDRQEAQQTLIGLIQSDRCVASGDTYFPEPWNEDILPEELNFDLPPMRLFAKDEKKPSLDEQIQSSQSRVASQKETPENGKENDFGR